MKKKPSLVFFLILSLATIASCLILGRLFFFKPKTLPSPTAPTPTLVPTFVPPKVEEGKGESITELTKTLELKFPLFRFLPYETEKFLIDYAAPLHLKATLKTKENISETKKEILNWIQSKDVDPTTHQIDWFTPEP